MQNATKLKVAAESEQSHGVAEVIEAALRDADIDYQRVEEAFVLSVETEVKSHDFELFAVEGGEYSRHFAIINPNVLGARLPADAGRRLRILADARQEADPNDRMLDIHFRELLS